MQESKFKLVFRVQTSYPRVISSGFTWLSWHGSLDTQVPIIFLSMSDWDIKLGNSNPTQRELIVGTAERSGSSLKPCQC